MSNRIGRLTLSASLIVAGTGLLISNLTNMNLGWLLSRAWPLILIGLGLEWIASSRRLGDHEKLQIDGAAIAVLVVVAMVASITGESYRVVRSPNALDLSAPHPLTPPAVLALPIRRELTTAYDLIPEGIKTIEVSQTAASVLVEAGPILRAELQVIGWGRTSDHALEVAESVRLAITSGAVTTLRAESSGNGADRVQVTLRITVPEGIEIRVKTSSGLLQVKNIKARVTVEASSGSIMVDQAGGDLLATSSSGSIEIAGVKGSLRANTSSGSITVRNSEGPVSLQASSGRISVEAATVTGPIDLTAASGPISVTLPADANVNIRARSSSGTVSGSPWLLIGEGRNSGTATLGAGEQLVRLNTGSGSITLGIR